MVNPATGETRECSAWGTGLIPAVQAKIAVSNCVEQLEALGYKRADEFKSGKHWVEEVHRKTQEELQKLRLELRSEPTCLSGILVQPNGRIGSVNRNAQMAGLRFGDEVISYGGVPFSTKEAMEEWIKQHHPGDDLVITVRGEVHKVTVRCEDRNKVVREYIRIYEMAEAGDWDGCLHGVARREQLDSPLSFLAWTRLQCAQGKRFAAGENLTRMEAGYAYETMRLRIRESSVSGEALENIRGSVLDYISGLRQRGFPSLADDLEAQYDSAVKGVTVAGVPETRPTPEKATGTCFAVRADGVLITAYHVVKDAKSIRVHLADGTVTEARLQTFSAGTDLAVLQTDVQTSRFLPLAPAGSVQVGDHVFTMGYPVTEVLGREPKFTDGAVSALSGVGGEASLLQISVPVQPGNSGGPLVNERAEVVGVVTSTAAVKTFLIVTGTLPQNVNWAVKAEYVRPLFNAPSVKSASVNREEAVKRVSRAICMVEASSR
jgi:S1-C subfamily serine protease